MSESPQLTAGEWVNQHTASGLSVENGCISIMGTANPFAVNADAPSDVPIVLSGDRLSVGFHLNGHTLPIVEMRNSGSGLLAFHGPGTVGQLTIAPATAQSTVHLTLTDGAQLQRLDATGAEHLRLMSEDGTGLVYLSTGETTVVECLGTTHVGTLRVQAPVLRKMGDNLSADVIRCDHDGPLAIEGSAWVSAELFEPDAVRLRDPSGLRITGRCTDLDVTLAGGSFAIEGGKASGENLRFNGSTGTVSIAAGTLTEPSFATGSSLILDVRDGGEVRQIIGRADIRATDRAIVIGHEATGLSLSGLGLRGVEAVENLNFLELDRPVLDMLEAQTHRLSGHWPRRRAALRQARETPVGARSEPSRRLAVARYWLAVERLLIEKNAIGRDLSMAHEIAEDTRRHASNRKHPERWLLELSRFAGYGARIARPLWRWVLVALGFSLLIRQLAGGICWSGCSVDSGLTLWWDVLIAPVNFIRPVDDGSTLANLVEGHTPARMFAFVARAIGTWLLLSLALAVRRYIRTT